MKHIIVTGLFLLVSGAYAQGGINPSITFELLGSREGSGEGTGKIKAEGSPYYNDKFLHAEIAGIEGSSKSRYNAEADQIEIEYKDEIFALPKDNRYNTVKIANVVYRLYNYTNQSGQSVQGYLIECYSKNEISLLKRDRIKLQKEKQATSSYSSYTPPKYIKVNPEYYLKLKNGNIVEFPKNKKALSELFTNKKSEIDAFFKANKLSFKEEKDMTKITEFAASL